MDALCGHLSLVLTSRWRATKLHPPRQRARRCAHFQLAQVCQAAHRDVSTWLPWLPPCDGRGPAGTAEAAAADVEGEEPAPAGPWPCPARAALALLASLCLHLGGSPGVQAANLPSMAEDKLLEVVRLLESKLETAAQLAGEALGGALPGAPTLQGGAGSPDQSQEQWRALVEDVWEVVDSNFMDARGAGFSREHWRELRDDALSRPLPTRAAAHGAIRDMVRSLRDPYSRFISPEEFNSMLKYDVSGVGLNLGTAEEFVNKTHGGEESIAALQGIPLPGFDPPTEPAFSQPGPDAIASDPGVSGGAGPPGALPASSSGAAPGSSDDGSSMGSSSGSLRSGSGSAAAAASSGSSRGLSRGPGGIFVLGLIKGSAADEAGLQQGDELLAVEGRGVEGQSPFQVASLLAGEESEPADGLGLLSKRVQLQVRKYGSEEVVGVDLERPLRVLPSPVTARLERPATGLPPLLQSALPGGGGGAQGAVGYVKLSSFNARAQRDLVAAVRQLEREGAGRIVLDLRDNRGGLVSEGIEVARLFLQGDALVVRTAGKARASSAPITAAGPALTTAPLVVLVNEHTASASEILAGALQDNCRAVLAGKRTFGKGLIQSVYELNDGSGLVLTVGKYLTPRGVDIDQEGIRPQFRSLPSPDAAEGALRACRLTPRSLPLLQQ